MLPPMASFPLFTLLEDLGYLPQVAFNLDNLFKKASAHGKQALTMCMGFGCNAAGVISCRIIDSPRERLIAVLTITLSPVTVVSDPDLTGADFYCEGCRAVTIAGCGCDRIGRGSVGVLMTLAISRFLSKLF